MEVGSWHTIRVVNGADRRELRDMQLVDLTTREGITSALFVSPGSVTTRPRLLPILQRQRGGRLLTRLGLCRWHASRTFSMSGLTVAEDMWNREHKPGCPGAHYGDCP